MKFTYKVGDEPKVWIVKTEKLMNAEAEAIERVTGIRFPEWDTELRNARMSAVHALLWVLLKREIPTLAYDAVQFCADDYELDFDDDEKLEILNEIDAAVAGGAPMEPESQAAYDDLVAAVGHLRVPTELEVEPEAAEPTFDDAGSAGEVDEVPKGTVSLVS